MASKVKLGSSVQQPKLSRQSDEKKSRRPKDKKGFTKSSRSVNEANLGCSVPFKKFLVETQPQIHDIKITDHTPNALNEQDSVGSMPSIHKSQKGQFNDLGRNRSMNSRIETQ